MEIISARRMLTEIRFFLIHVSSYTSMVLQRYAGSEKSKTYYLNRRNLMQKNILQVVLKAPVKLKNLFCLICVLIRTLWTMSGIIDVRTL